MPQSTVANNMTVAIVGQIADANDVSIASRVSEESAAEIPFGVMVIRGTDKERQALLLHTSSAAMEQLLAGVSTHHASYDKPAELGEVGLKPKVTFGVLRKGRVYVLPEETVAPGDAVRVRAVAGAGEQAGAFRKTADDTSDCIDISLFAQWISAGSTTVPAILEIDMTNSALADADS
jgi:hypothetical protein